jgi:hypothetical protein
MPEQEHYFNLHVASVAVHWNYQSTTSQRQLTFNVTKVSKREQKVHVLDMPDEPTRV